MPLATAEKGVIKFPEDRGWPQDLARYRLFFLGDVKGYLAFGERLRKEMVAADEFKELGPDKQELAIATFVHNREKLQADCNGASRIKHYDAEQKTGLAFRYRW